MRVWLERSEKERGTAYLGAEHGGTAGFVRLHAGARELLRAAGYLGAAVVMRKFTARRRKRSRGKRG